MNHRRWLVPALGLTLSLGLAHCGPRSGGSTSAGDSTATPGSGAALTGAGATFPYPIYSKWFDTYREQTGVAINYQSIGSGAGIQQLKAGTVDFGASDAPLSDEQLSTMPRPVVHIPTVGGAVVLAYNLPQLARPLRLDSDAVAGIFLGTITKWNDPPLVKLNPGVTLPATAILPAHRSDGSGTTNIFTTWLSKVSASWKSQVGANTSVNWPAGVGSKGNDGVAGVVRQTPGAIGYVELAFARQNQLSMALLRNRAGQFVEPTLASILAAIDASAAALEKDVRTPTVDAPGQDSYPIAALTFLLVYQDQPDARKAKQLVDFIAWAIHDGQSLAAPLDYATLPPALVRVNEATLKRLTSAGKPIALFMRPTRRPA
jgi:phosphate transport system substrate-binding protein